MKAVRGTDDKVTISFDYSHFKPHTSFDRRSKDRLIQLVGISISFNDASTARKANILQCREWALLSTGAPFPAKAQPGAHQRERGARMSPQGELNSSRGLRLCVPDCDDEGWCSVNVYYQLLMFLFAGLVVMFLGFYIRKTWMVFTSTFPDSRARLLGGVEAVAPARAGLGESST